LGGQGPAPLQGQQRPVHVHHRQRDHAALKQFRSIHWVKTYDQNGRIERPFGHSDSIPFSLEP
jgi:hypothetical protein